MNPSRNRVQGHASHSPGECGRVKAPTPAQPSIASVAGTCSTLQQHPQVRVQPRLHPCALDHHAPILHPRTRPNRSRELLRAQLPSLGCSDISATWKRLIGSNGSGPIERMERHHILNPLKSQEAIILRSVRHAESGNGPSLSSRQFPWEAALDKLLCQVDLSTLQAQDGASLRPEGIPASAAANSLAPRATLGSNVPNADAITDIGARIDPEPGKDLAASANNPSCSLTPSTMRFVADRDAQPAITAHVEEALHASMRDSSKHLADRSSSSGQTTANQPTVGPTGAPLLLASKGTQGLPERPLVHGLIGLTCGDTILSRRGQFHSAETLLKAFEAQGPLGPLNTRDAQALAQLESRRQLYGRPTGLLGQDRGPSAPANCPSDIQCEAAHALLSGVNSGMSYEKLRLEMSANMGLRQTRSLPSPPKSSQHAAFSLLVVPELMGCIFPSTTFCPAAHQLPTPRLQHLQEPDASCSKDQRTPYPDAPSLIETRPRPISSSSNSVAPGPTHPTLLSFQEASCSGNAAYGHSGAESRGIQKRSWLGPRGRRESIAWPWQSQRCSTGMQGAPSALCQVGRGVTPGALQTGSRNGLDDQSPLHQMPASAANVQGSLVSIERRAVSSDHVLDGDSLDGARGGLSINAKVPRDEDTMLQLPLMPTSNGINGLDDLNTLLAALMPTLHSGLWDDHVAPLPTAKHRRRARDALTCVSSECGSSGYGAPAAIRQGGVPAARTEHSFCVGLAAGPELALAENDTRVPSGASPGLPEEMGLHQSEHRIDLVNGVNGVNWVKRVQEKPSRTGLVEADQELQEALEGLGFTIHHVEVPEWHEDGDYTESPKQTNHHTSCISGNHDGLLITGLVGADPETGSGEGPGLSGGGDDVAESGTDGAQAVNAARGGSQALEKRKRRDVEQAQRRSARHELRELQEWVQCTENAATVLREAVQYVQHLKARIHTKEL